MLKNGLLIERISICFSLRLLLRQNEIIRIKEQKIKSKNGEKNSETIWRYEKI